MLVTLLAAQESSRNPSASPRENSPASSNVRARVRPTHDVSSTHAPQLLPPADEFHLTLSEDRTSTLPLGPSCTGEAEQTLTCRAFIVTLQNLSKKTVRISWGGCNEPGIRIDRKEPPSTSGWWPVSQIKSGSCRPMTWARLRLKPHKNYRYTTRLISPRRESWPFEPGSYTLRAEWALLGCTEKPKGTDCLTPLQIIRPPSSASAFNF